MKPALLKTSLTAVAFGALSTVGATAASFSGAHHDDDHDDHELHYVEYFGAFTPAPAVVTTNEAAVEAIFAVNAPAIDLRYLATRTITVPAAVASDVNTGAEVGTITAAYGAQHTADASSVINMYFVDLLSTCGATDNAPGIAGCAGGNFHMVESPLAAAGIGPELVAHEFGHNLLLGHTPDAVTGAPSGNLMDPTLNGNTTLILAQQTRMLTDAKVGTDGGGRFIEIRPIIVAPAPVPEPSAAAFLSLAGLLLFGRRRR